ncbi:MAG: transcriptional activator RfaH [Acidobacteria bacterium]|nr:transcriptional activator RfaH [Acidobacteriota bacterium]
MAVDFNKLDKRWLALQVRSGWELKSAADLKLKGFDEFVPVYQEKRKWSDRTKIVTAALFTGYVFVRFDLNNPLRIISVPGALRFVSIGHAPLPIDDGEIESLQILSKAGAHCRPCDYFEVGQQVRIGRGALRGLQGRIMRVKSKDRLVVSVSLLKRSVFLELGSDDVASMIRSQAGNAASAWQDAPNH